MNCRVKRTATTTIGILSGQRRSKRQLGICILILLGHCLLETNSFAVRPFLIHSVKCSLPGGLRSNKMGGGDDNGEQNQVDLDLEWKRFRQAAPTDPDKAPLVVESLRPKDDLFDPDAYYSLNLALSWLLLAVMFLLGVYLVGYLSNSSAALESYGSLADDAVEDIDSAKGRYEAITGGLWF